MKANNWLHSLSHSKTQGQALNRTLQKKKKKGRCGLSAYLPRHQILLTLNDEQKAGAIDTFFVTIKEELEITPAKVQVLEYRQEKAVFLDDNGTRSIVEASRPKHSLGKAICNTQLLAYIIVGKY